jgi:hypothetical protein
VSEEFQRGIEKSGIRLRYRKIRTFDGFESDQAIENSFGAILHRPIQLHTHPACNDVSRSIKGDQPSQQNEPGPTANVLFRQGLPVMLLVFTRMTPTYPTHCQSFPSFI